MSAALQQVFLTYYNNGKVPSESLLAVLGVLLTCRRSYTAQIEARSGVEHRNCLRLLRKLVELGLVSRRMETVRARAARRGKQPRVYYALTPDGRALAEQIMAGVSR